MRHSTLAMLLAASLSMVACGPRNGDKLDDSDLAASERVPTEGEGGEPRCAARFASDEVKRQLFARAAEIRGSNADNYARIAGFTMIDMTDAIPAGAVSAGEPVDCRARTTLRLPAGLKVAGGRTALSGDIAYHVAAGEQGTVTLGQSDAITIPLATLTQNGSAPPRSRAPATAPATIPQVEPAPIAAAPDVRQPEPPPPPPPSASSAAAPRPSFDCRRARSASERAVCDSPSLAALDRDMAAQYRSAVANGGPEERRMLAQTRDRFLGYRERCRSDACIANVYRGRMREIDDILAGRWQAPR